MVFRSVAKAFLSLSGTYFNVFLTWCTIQRWYSVFGKAAAIASLIPVKPSAQMINTSLIPYRIMDCINVENGIDLVQWPVLPVFDLWQDLISHIRNKALRSFKAINIFDGFGNLPGSHSFGIHGNDLLINIGNIFLTFFHNLWFKC